MRATSAYSRITIGAVENAPHIVVAGDPKSSADILDRTAAEVDRAVAALASRQHGMVARWQLLQLGMSATMIKTRLRHGALHRLHRGVFACGHRAITAESRWMAAVLAFGPQAVLSHRSAAQLWGLLPRSSIAPEVTRPGRTGGRARLVAHEGVLMADEVVRRWGIPVTSVPRTLLDLAGMAREREVERAWNEAEVREYRDELSVPDLIERYPGRPGTLLLARLASGQTQPLGITRGELEEAFLALVGRFELPRPRLNVHLAIRDRFYEIDCLWEDRKVAIELDGAAVHGTRKAFQEDRERDRILTAEGYTTARLTWHQITETPAEVATDLRRILTPYPLSDGSGALRPLPPR